MTSQIQWLLHIPGSISGSAPHSTIELVQLESRERNKNVLVALTLFIPRLLANMCQNTSGSGLNKKKLPSQKEEEFLRSKNLG